MFAPDRSHNNVWWAGHSYETIELFTALKNVILDLTLDLDHPRLLLLSVGHPFWLLGAEVALDV